MKLKTSLQLSAIFPIIFAIVVSLILAFRFRSESGIEATDALFIALMGVTGLIMAAIILFYSRDILLKIRLLNDWINAILKGDLNQPMNFKATDDEVGRLSEALAKMLRELKDAYATLHKESAEFQRDAVQNKQRADASQRGVKQLSDAIVRLKESQEEILAKERAVVLEQVIKGISHDFSEAITPVLGTTELLLASPDSLQDKEKVIGHIKTIHSSILQTRRLLKNLAGYFHASRESAGPIDINNTIKEAISLTESYWKDMAQSKGMMINVRTNLSIVPAIAADEIEMRDAVENLITNSIDAMPKGGTITISTRADERSVYVEIADTGKGMPEDIKRRCLEPFFSTKNGNGIGMGLTIVNSTVNRYQGTLSIESESDKGTRITIRLPKWVRTAEEQKAAAADHIDAGKYSIMVIDDEPGCRKIIESVLESKGYRVDSAASGSEGLEKIKARKFDAVIVDRAMPQMNGDEFTKVFRQTSKDIPVIMLTGYGDIMKEENDMPAGINALLQKPAGIEEIENVLIKVLKS